MVEELKCWDSCTCTCSVGRRLFSGLNRVEGVGEGALGGSEINLTASVPETRPKHNRLKSEQLKDKSRVRGDF